MIENYNASKEPTNGEFQDIQKYVGVASIKVVGINPTNEKLRSYGWNISPDAPEPEYVKEKTDKNGKPYTMTRVRFLVEIQDLEEKPVIFLDFFCRKELSLNSDGTKCKIIDCYGRTAWGTKVEIKAHKIPQYANGAANIDTNYKMCHPGEEELITFLMKLLNITPLTLFDRASGDWKNTANPGKLTIDNWDALCNGNIKELASYISYQPDNRVKVILGVNSTEDNKTYQTFINTGYIGNGAVPDRNTGVYTSAQKLIDKYMANRNAESYIFSASPVKKWGVSASQVTDASESMSDLLDDNSLEPQENDLPWV